MCGKSLGCGPARAESPASPEPRATPWVPCPHPLRPVRAKVKANRSPILLPLQGVGVYTLIPRALPWAENWLPFQGAPLHALFVYHVQHRCKGHRADIWRRSEEKHCSSLCSQSEGHEHVANMTYALGHDFVGFSARAGPPQYSSPSLCEQSELQCFAPELRRTL